MTTYSCTLGLIFGSLKFVLVLSMNAAELVCLIKFMPNMEPNCKVLMIFQYVGPAIAILLLHHHTGTLGKYGTHAMYSQVIYMQPTMIA